MVTTTAGSMRVLRMKKSQSAFAGYVIAAEGVSG